MYSGVMTPLLFRDKQAKWCKPELHIVDAFIVLFNFSKKKTGDNVNVRVWVHDGQIGHSHLGPVGA